MENYCLLVVRVWNCSYFAMKNIIGYHYYDEDITITIYQCKYEYSLAMINDWV